METKNINGHTLRLYTSIDEFPAERRSLLSRYTTELVELDFTLEAMQDRIQSAILAIQEGKQARVHAYMINLYYSLVLLKQGGYYPEELALGVLSHSIDGELVTDLHEDILGPRMTALSLPSGVVLRTVKEIRHKINLTRQIHFPKTAEDHGVSFADYLNAVINNVIEDTPQTAAAVSSIASQIDEMSEPIPLNPADPKNTIIQDKKAMEALFAALEERGVHQPKKLTEYEVYARLETYSRQAKPQRE